MTDSEALLHASNRAAHKVARAAIAFRRCNDAAHEDAGGYLALVKADMEVRSALDEYEEVERRAQREATG